jgi:hypothetical protein
MSKVEQPLDRTVLPPPDPPFQGKIDVAFKNSKADFPEPRQCRRPTSLRSGSPAR